jgi:hypothetical protein
MAAESKAGSGFCKIFIEHEAPAERYHWVPLSAGSRKMHESFSCSL